MKSKIIALVSILLLALVFAVPALAGGWATITLEELPTGVTAGVPLTVRFVVRQHGRTLLEGLTPTINARNADTGEAISAEATAVDDQPGRYEATLNFPTPGTWEWRIQAFTMDQRMPDLAISASAPVERVAVRQSWAVPPFIAGAMALIGILAVIALAFLKQPRWALGLVIMGVLVGGAGLASAASKGSKPNLPSSASQTATAAETGQALFVTKGCVTCHLNSRIDDKYYQFQSEFGPNLSHYAASREYLLMWLKDPSAVKPNTQMPNLELGESEIEALAAFLSNNPNAVKPPVTASPAAEQVVTATPLAEQSAKSVSSQRTPTDQASACSNLDRSQGLLVSYSRDAGSYIDLVDPATGESLCGVERIDLGIAPTYAYAPDRSAMVVLSAKTYAQRDWRLNWIDLRSWKSVDIGVILDAWSQGIAVNPQHTHVAIAYARLTKGNEPVLEGYNLVQVNVLSKGEKIEREMDISPRLVGYVGDGESILVYGSSFDSTKKISAPPAKVGLYRASDLSLIWETELDGVLDGIIINGEEKQFEPDQMTQWQPGLALSPDRDKLYIVHADADKLTTIDLTTRQVGTAEIKPRLSWLERLLRLTSSVAYAKVFNGTNKWAVLSPDGARLYVIGFTGQPYKDSQGNWQFDTLPFGLQVIDTADSREIAHVESEASEIDVSADGATLFLRGWTDNKSWTDVLDAANPNTKDHLDGQLIYPARTLAGESLIVGGPEGQWARAMSVFDKTNYSPISQLPGKGFWVSIP